MQNIVANRLKELREERRLTQEEVAKLMDLDFSTVSKHENMDRPISRSNIEKYAKLYKVPTHELFFVIESERED